MDAPRIETARLVLRQWREDDLAPYAAICADPEVMRYIATGATLDTARTARAIERMKRQWEEGYGLFAVELGETGALIGFAGLSRPDFLPEVLPSVEIGWRLGQPYWGNGYATEAALAALDFATGTLGRRDIVSICQSGNEASERVMRKIGLTFSHTAQNADTARTLKVYRLPG